MCVDHYSLLDPNSDINLTISVSESYGYTGPLTPPSDSSSAYSPHSHPEDGRQRRDSNDSHDTVTSSAASTTEVKREKRLGKDEKLAISLGITKFINVYDIINLPWGKYEDIQHCLFF